MHNPNLIELKAADHPVQAVTIFSSARSGYGMAGKAEVIRNFSIELKDGENRVHIHGLSSNIDLDSVRVSGLDDSVRVFDLVCTLKQLRHPAEGDLNETLRLLQQKRALLDRFRDNHTKQAGLLSQYAATLKGDVVTPEAATTFFSSMLQSGRENAETAQKFSEEIVILDREIANMQDVASEHKGSMSGDVMVVLNSRTATSAELRLTYLVDGAWKATYDLYATTESGRPSPAVELHFRARVSQSTGEDWNNTSLTLSTAAFNPLEQGLPAFKALRITPIRPTAPPLARGMAAAAAPARKSRFMAAASVDKEEENYEESDDDMGFGLFDGDEAPGTQPQTLVAEADTGPNSKPTTVVNESPFSRTYRVAGNSTIPSDGREHQVLIAVLPFEAKLSYVALPRARTVAYMQCEVTNTSEYRLLPGPVNVFMDDSSVSRTQIQDVDVNDTFECTLGADPSIRLTFARTAKPAQVEGGAFAEPTRTVSYTVTTTIKNAHQFDLPRVLVRDSIPVSGDDKRIRVILRKPAKLAEAKEGEEVDVDGAKVSWGKDGLKDGKIEWVAEVKSGEEVKLETEFEVRAPADSKWQLKLDS